METRESKGSEETSEAKGSVETRETKRSSYLTIELQREHGNKS